MRDDAAGAGILMERRYECPECEWWDDVRPEADRCPACGGYVLAFAEVDPLERDDWERNRD